MPIDLRPWLSDDASALIHAYMTTPDLGPQFDNPDLSTIDHARTFIAEYLPHTPSIRNWAIVVDEQAVGNVGLAEIEWHHETAWAYYWLAAEARGQGYAARALASVSSWAFAEGLYRLELGHRVNNPASCKVAKRAGYRAEGTERRKLRYGNDRFDVETHARLRTDPVPDIEAFPLTTSSHY